MYAKHYCYYFMKQSITIIVIIYIISMALAAASKDSFASLRPKFERNCSFHLMFSSRVNSYSESRPLRISTAGSAINEFMIELLSSILVEFSRFTLFRRWGRDFNSKDDFKLDGNLILVLRLLAIIDVALDIHVFSVKSIFIISKNYETKSINYQYSWNLILHQKFCNY